MLNGEVYLTPFRPLLEHIIAGISDYSYCKERSDPFFKETSLKRNRKEIMEAASRLDRTGFDWSLTF